MTTPHDHETPHEGADMGPVTVDDHTTISVPMVLTIGGIVLGAVIWANALNVALEGVKKDQSNDRDRLQRIEQAVDRVEVKIDTLKYAATAQPQRQPETDYAIPPRRFDR